MHKLIFFLFLSLTCKCCFSQKKETIPLARDTIVVAKLITFDSLVLKSNSTRTGIKFYYGVRHLKLGLQSVDAKNISDTLTVAYVYNKITESSLCAKDFGLNTDSSYIFILGIFTPCHSDFPRIEGSCDAQDFFYPTSNSLTKKYKTIYRVINVVPIQ